MGSNLLNPASRLKQNGAGAAAGCCWQMCGRVRGAASGLVSVRSLDVLRACVNGPAAGRCCSVAACAMELGCWCRCRVLLLDVWPRTLSELG